MKPKPPKILLYGEPGTGKTAFAMTLGPVLQLLDLDDGAITGQFLQDEHTAARQAVAVHTEYDSDPHRPTAFRKVWTMVDEIAKKCKAGTYPYQALCVDGLTTLADSAIKTVMMGNGRPGENPNQPEWGTAIRNMTELMVKFRMLPIVCIMTAHTAEVFIEGKTEIKLGVYGKNLPGQICGAFDEVWFARCRYGAGGKTIYTIQTKRSPDVLARSRYQVPDKTNMDEGLVKILEEHANWKFGTPQIKETANATN